MVDVGARPHERRRNSDRRSPAPWLRALFVVLLGVGALGGAAPPAHADATPDVPVTPAPAWVSRLALEDGAPGASATGRGGIVDELLDDQVRVGATVERYRRTVRRLTTTAALETAGQIEIVFDPLYEHLRLHGVSIVRGVQRIDALKTTSVRVLQREADLDERVYNGDLTALVVLKDLRVGDVIDVDYTLEGQNPVFAGHFVDNEPLSSPRGAERVRVRALLPTARPVSFRSVGILLDPTEGRADGLRELVWDRRDVPPAPEDDQVPYWFDTYAFVSFSELATWGDVARWAAPLFEAAKTPTPAVTEKALAIAAGAKTPEERARATLRFVQDEIRYLGIEMGASSHHPHDPARVLDQRFGDCKDKALLFVALLGALDVEAEVALVDAERGAHVAERPPSPFAFNHAIVRVRLPGRDVWVDPTRSQERGPLGGSPVTLGRALVVDPATTDLATIDAPVPTEPLIFEREAYAFDGPNARLDVTTRFRGVEADSMRRHLANTPRDRLRADYLNYYSEIYASIEPVGEVEVSDDSTADVVSVRERYTLKDPLRDGGLPIFVGAIRPYARKPRVTRRATPLAVEFPTYDRHEIQVDGVSLFPLDDLVLHDETFDFTRRGETNGETTLLKFELRSKRDFVPVESVAAHLTLRGSILEATSWTLGVQERPQARADQERHVARGVAIFGALGLTIVLSALVPVVRRRRWAKKVRAKTGETAALAQNVATRVAAERLLLAPRCTCGGTYALHPTGGWSALAYGGREVTAGRAVCSSCGERRIRYFAVTGPLEG